MQAQVNLPDISIEPLVNLIFSTRRITRANQTRLMSVLLSKQTLSEKERVQINQVFTALQNGLIRVVE